MEKTFIFLYACSIVFNVVVSNESLTCHKSTNENRYCSECTVSSDVVEEGNSISVRLNEYVNQSQIRLTEGCESIIWDYSPEVAKSDRHMYITIYVPIASSKYKPVPECCNVPLSIRSCSMGSVVPNFTKATWFYSLSLFRARTSHAFTWNTSCTADKDATSTTKLITTLSEDKTLTSAKPTDATSTTKRVTTLLSETKTFTSIKPTDATSTTKRVTTLLSETKTFTSIKPTATTSTTKLMTTFSGRRAFTSVEPTDEGSTSNVIPLISTPSTVRESSGEGSAGYISSLRPDMSAFEKPQGLANITDWETTSSGGRTWTFDEPTAEGSAESIPSFFPFAPASFIPLDATSATKLATISSRDETSTSVKPTDSSTRVVIINPPAKPQWTEYIQRKKANEYSYVCMFDLPKDTVLENKQKNLTSDVDATIFQRGVFQMPGYRYENDTFYHEDQPNVPIDCTERSFNNESNVVFQLSTSSPDNSTFTCLMLWLTVTSTDEVQVICMPHNATYVNVFTGPKNVEKNNLTTVVLIVVFSSVGTITMLLLVVIIIYRKCKRRSNEFLKDVKKVPIELESVMNTTSTSLYCSSDLNEIEHADILDEKERRRYQLECTAFDMQVPKSIDVSPCNHDSGYRNSDVFFGSTCTIQPEKPRISALSHDSGVGSECLSSPTICTDSRYVAEQSPRCDFTEVTNVGKTERSFATKGAFIETRAANETPQTKLSQIKDVSDKKAIRSFNTSKSAPGTCVVKAERNDENATEKRFLRAPFRRDEKAHDTSSASNRSQSSYHDSETLNNISEEPSYICKNWSMCAYPDDSSTFQFGVSDAATPVNDAAHCEKRQESFSVGSIPHVSINAPSAIAELQGVNQADRQLNHKVVIQRNQQNDMPSRNRHQVCDVSTTRVSDADVRHTQDSLQTDILAHVRGNSQTDPEQLCERRVINNEVAVGNDSLSHHHILTDKSMPCRGDQPANSSFALPRDESGYHSKFHFEPVISLRTKLPDQSQAYVRKDSFQPLRDTTYLETTLPSSTEHVKQTDASKPVAARDRYCGTAAPPLH